MKREAIGGNEAALNEDFLLPFIDDMLQCRREALEKINAMFGTEITVDFSSSWRINEKEIASQLAERNGENAETISVENPEQEQEQETPEQEKETPEQEQEQGESENDENNKNKRRNNNE